MYTLYTLYTLYILYICLVHHNLCVNFSIIRHYSFDNQRSEINF